MPVFAAVAAPPSPKSMKFPVKSLLAGNFGLQRRVRSRLPPPAASQVRTCLSREFAFPCREAAVSAGVRARAIGAIGAVWAAAHIVLLGADRQYGTAALMHEPSDSALLWDAVRVMTRLLRQAAALPGAPALQWRDRRRLARNARERSDTNSARLRHLTLRHRPRWPGA